MEHRRTNRALILVLGLPSILPAAPVGTEFGYQGQLRSGGIPVNGTCDFEFSLWRDATSVLVGDKLGSAQLLTAVDVVRGFIAVELNGAGQFGPDAYNGDVRWLQLAVRCPSGAGAFTTLTPRTKLNPPPYAQYALDGPAGGGGDSIWSVNGSSAYYNRGRVGVGTNTPGKLLQLGSSAVPNSEGMMRLESRSGNNANQRNWEIGVPETDDDLSGKGFSFVIDDTQFGTDPEFVIHWGNGNVGIGTVNPSSKLEVGSFLLSGTAIRGMGTLGVYGEGGDAGLRGYAPATHGGGSIGVHGQAQATTIDFGFVFNGGIGVKGESPSNIGVLGTSTQSYGVKGESQNNDGVQGTSHHASRSGVWGHNDAGGHGVSGSATGSGFAGVYGSGGVNGVVGETANGDASGVYGQNNGAGWGVAGYAAGSPFAGRGVEGISDGVGGYGVVGRAHGLNGVALHGEADDPSRTALWAYNPSGRAGLFNGYVEIYGYLDVDGPAYINVLTIQGGSDLAEPFDVRATEDQNRPGQGAGPDENADSDVRPGSVVVIDPENPGKLKLSLEEYDRKVAGIISGANGLSPGMVMGAKGHTLADGQHPVAMTGRVWCYCDAACARIEPGDLLTTSSVAAHAMKATDLPRAQGAIIGKAMTSLEQGGRGLVLVLVNLQ